MRRKRSGQSQRGICGRWKGSGIALTFLPQIGIGAWRLDNPLGIHSITNANNFRCVRSDKIQFVQFQSHWFRSMRKEEKPKRLSHSERVFTLSTRHTTCQHWSPLPEGVTIVESEWPDLCPHWTMNFTMLLSPECRYVALWSMWLLTLLTFLFSNCLFMNAPENQNRCFPVAFLMYADPFRPTHSSESNKRNGNSHLSSNRWQNNWIARVDCECWLNEWLLRLLFWWKFRFSGKLFSE